MPDFSPVAQLVNPPNPQQGLSTLSSILGIKQQQQNLQTGQYAQQSAQAEATQKQQQSSELQAAQKLIMNGVQSGRYTNTDGTFNRSKAADDIETVAPTYGQGISNQLLSGANEVVANRTALQSLTNDQRKTIGGALQSLAADPNVDNTKVIDTMDALIDQNPDPQFRRLVLSNLAHMPQSGKASDLQQALSTMAGGLTGQSPIASGTNAAGQNQVVNTLTGKRSAPELGPGTSNPSTPQVAGATTRVTGVGSSDIDRANAVSATIQPSKAAIPITEEIDDLSEQIHSGKFAAKISKAAAAVGLSEATYARQVLEKDLNNIKGLISQGAGSDARAEQLSSRLPPPEADAKTIHNAMDFTRGLFKQNLARGNLLNTVRAKDPELRGFQYADDTLTNSADPLMHEFATLKTPQERSAFYARHFSTAEEMKAFRNKVAGMGHLNVGQ